LDYIKKIKNYLGENPRVRSWLLEYKNVKRIVNFSDEDPRSHTKARNRWLEANPNTHLTWGKQVSGEPFIRKVLEYTTLDASTSIVEVGPGYGRLLMSILDLNLHFNRYCGIDISLQNVEYLKGKFGDSNIHFLQGDIESMRIGVQFDIMISSLTFKHLFPSFEKALWNISKQMEEGGMAIFDLIEGNVAYNERDGTFIRLYAKAAVKDVIKSCNFGLVAFDNVTHAEGYKRLLVVAKKRS
jgi:SAM-dependent methyltransferase